MKSDNPRIRRWDELTGTDFREMDRRNTVVVVSVSPLEVHGPYLPVVADSIESDAIGFAAMERLCDRHDDISFVVLPPVWVSTDVVPQPGSLMFRPTTMIRVLEDLGRSLARQGFHHVWVMNFHGGPRHFVSIEVAADRVSRRYGIRMVSLFSLLIARYTKGETESADLLGDAMGIDKEKLRGDTHAGAVETSLLLHLDGDHVDKRVGELPRRTIDTTLAEKGKKPLDSSSAVGIVRGLGIKLRYFLEHTYSGAPALGTAERGEKALEVLADLAADAAGELWTGEIGPEDCHSPLWPARWVLTTPVFTALFEKAVGFRSPVF